MRSKAPASPCWARRMASASVISLVSDRLARVTVPVRDASRSWDATPAPQVVRLLTYEIRLSSYRLLDCSSLVFASGLGKVLQVPESHTDSQGFINSQRGGSPWDRAQTG